ncbi:MAG: STAS domain-containing protein [Chitinophagaceae bacterium]
MKVNIDTKEKFTVLTPLDADLHANLAANLTEITDNYLQQPVKNLVLNFQHVQSIDNQTAQIVATQQQKFYENNSSFVVCCLTEPVEEQLDKYELLEMLNTTPTESEAWDIVQMEEIERELMDGEDFEFIADD